MGAIDLDRIERELSLKLPAYYRRFLMNFPQLLVETKLDLGWCQEAPAERQFRNDPEQLIHWNQFVREPGTPWTEDEGPWPERFFVIGDDQCGNYWTIDLNSDDEGVCFYDHDFGRFERQHGSLEEFKTSLLEEIKTFNQRGKKEA